MHVTIIFGCKCLKFIVYFPHLEILAKSDDNMTRTALHLLVSSAQLVDDVSKAPSVDCSGYLYDDEVEHLESLVSVVAVSLLELAHVPLVDGSADSTGQLQA